MRHPPRSGSHSRSLRFRPRLEPLEARVTPAQFSVTNLLDAGPGSLRAAVAAANVLPGADEIVFSPSGVGKIFLTSQIEVTDDLTITGAGRDALTLSGSNVGRIFFVSNNADLSATSLGMTEGKVVSGDGGAIFIDSGSVSLTDCLLFGNAAANGGAIFTPGGSVTLVNSWVRDNVAGGVIPGTGLGGGIVVSGFSTLNVTNSTISGNTAFVVGGGVDVVGGATGVLTQVTLSNNSAPRGGGAFVGNANLTIRNSTVTANLVADSTSGGGIFSAASFPTVISTIVSGNVAAADGMADVGGTFGFFEFNLVGSAGDATFNTFTGTVVGPASLNPLGFYGGRTPTHLPRFGSLAIDRGFAQPDVGTQDQRGVGFVRNYAGLPTDIGAVEFGSGLGSDLFAVGTDRGVPARVRVFLSNGTELSAISPYVAGFTGGVRVATGDFTGDGVQDVVTAAGPGGGPNVKVFDGLSGLEVASFFAFESTFDGGVSLGVADINADGTPDIVAGAGPGGGPRIIAIDGRRINEQDATGVINQDALLASFFAFVPAFNGGVTISSGDFNGDGRADLAFAAGPGGGPHVRVVDGTLLNRVDAQGVIRLDAALIGDTTDFSSFFAFGNPNFTGGVVLTTGDTNADGLPDLMVGIASGTTPAVFVRDAATKDYRVTFSAFEPGFTGGVRLASADTDRNGSAESIVIGRGPGGASQVRIVRGTDPSVVSFDDVLFPGFSGGVFVG